MHDFLYRRARDAMTWPVVTVGPQATLASITSIFDEHGFNALPVLDDGRFVGLVTKLDLLRGFVFTTTTVVPHYEEIMDESATTVMTTQPETVEPETPLPRVLQRMVDTGFKSFPVVEGERLVGMIAREDLVRTLRGSVEAASPRGTPS